MVYVLAIEIQLCRKARKRRAAWYNKYFLVSLSDIETIFNFIEKPNFGNMLLLLFEKDA